MKPSGPNKAAGGGPKSRRRRSELGALKAELQARIAEADWLKAHYDEQLRAAFAQVESLQARLRTAATSAQDPVAADDGSSAELQRVTAELDRLLAAEERYLDRIEELKAMGGRNVSTHD